MATAEISPASTASRRQFGPGPLTHVVLPLFLLAGLVAGIAAAVVYAYLWYTASTGPGKQLISRRLEEPLKLGTHEFNPYVWIAVLIPILVLGLFYVVWMYIRDGGSIGWPWGTFLGTLRCTVYALLAIIFMLPSVQAWDETRSESKVVVVFDASLSMVLSRDDVPDGRPLDQLPTRQDKVLKFLDDERINFFGRLLERNPVTAYRFGRHLDENYLVLDKTGRLWARAEWEENLRNPPQPGVKPPEDQVKKWTPEDRKHWLKPSVDIAIPGDLKDEDREKLVKEQELNQRLFTGTNLGDPLLNVFGRELSNMVQGIVVFTDGRSTEGTAQAIKELSERARKAEVPIFVVAVGEDREKVKIEIADLRVPEQIRPEDKFRATVDVTAEGLDEKERTELKVELDIQRFDRKDGKPRGEIILVETKPNGVPTGNEINLGQKVTLSQTNLKFTASAPPRAQADFPLDAATLAGAKATEGMKVEFKEDPEGELRFTARVAKNVREDFAGKEHKSDPASVQVVKRPLRVFLFAGGPMRDYQFVRTLLVREMDKSRAEVSIYLQPAPGQTEPRKGRVQDVPPDRLLMRFPDKLEDEKAVAVEDKFYNLAAYDVIVAFDPDWTQLSEQQLQLIERWVGTHGGGLVVIGGPVNTLQLARPGAHRDKVKPILDIYPVVLKDARIDELDRKTTEPWRLNFPGANAEMEFLKLDEDAPADKPLQGWEDFFAGRQKGVPDSPTSKHGFYNFYPVQQKKDGAIVVATFSDPLAKLADGSEQPYLAVMPYGSGKTVWLGSGETWRLRQHKESFHERFWTKLARYAGSGNLTRVNRRVVINMGRTFKANNYVPIEAQLFGPDLKPLPESAVPKLTLKLPAGVVDKELSKEIKLTAKPRSGGEWNGWFATRLLVKAPGEYTLELKADEISDTASQKFTVKEANPELDNTRPDFQTLRELASDAGTVMGRVSEDVRKELKERLARRRAAQPGAPDAKPAAPDAKEAAVEERLRLYFDLSNAELIPRCLKTEERMQRNRGAIDDLWDGGFTIWNREPPQPPIKMSWVLTIVAGLLSVEWLSRKLLRLA